MNKNISDIEGQNVQSSDLFKVFSCTIYKISLLKMGGEEYE
ncbi:hypothetical protein DOT_2158 [Desulfosporosinus sp. OT]|nr:hypothetical protein DOT_2158 [Desulfosporosinus sp. OT]